MGGNGFGLGVVCVESSAKHFHCIILPLNQWLSSSIICLRHLGRAKLHMITSATSWMHPSSSNPLLQHPIIHLQFNCPVQRNPFLRQHRIQSPCLRRIPGKSVKDRPTLTNGLLHSISYEIYHYFIFYQFAVSHLIPYLLADLGVFSDFFTEEVPVERWHQQLMAEILSA